jgi:hypothetical protein
MNAQEIIDVLNTYYDKDTFYEADLPECLEHGVGQWISVDEIGGGEGDGEYTHRVINFPAHGVYIKLRGYYSSYNGVDLDYDYEEVHPKEKTITVYE